MRDDIHGAERSGLITVSKALWIVVLIFAIIFGIGYLAYNYYTGFLVEPRIIDGPVLKPPVLENTTGSAIQFYPKMKFNHNKISYSIDPNCELTKKARMIDGFNELQELVPSISLYPVYTGLPDIEVSCDESIEGHPKEKYFIAGEGGAKGIIQTGRYNIITNGTILLHKRPKNSLVCEWSNIELHELIHVFGFDHTDNPNSLMYPYLQDCNQGLDKEIIDLLNELYTEENLPDLYFEDAKLTKKSRYINFNLTIKNSGSILSPATKITILEDGKAINSGDLSRLESISFGGGIYIEIKNLKLFSGNPSKIEFVIDYENQIKEIDKENNKIEFNLV